MARKAAEDKPSADPTSEGGADTFNFLNEYLIKSKAKGPTGQSNISLQRFDEQRQERCSWYKKHSSKNLVPHRQSRPNCTT
jgi:hypothetical protein